MKRIIILSTILLAGTKLCAQQQADTFSLYFPTGVDKIMEDAKARLDSIAYHDILRRGVEVQIIGYADYVGNVRSNDALSKRRAANVSKAVQFYGIIPAQITMITGYGEIERGMGSDRSGYPADRRVDIIVGTNFKAVPKNAPPPPPAPKLPDPPKPKQIITPSKQIQIANAASGDTTAISMEEVKVNETFVLDNIYFFPGRHKVKPESATALTKLYNTLKKNKTVRIRIEGHICCIKDFVDALDEDTRELKLSENRAREVYNFLVSKGIEKERLEFKGFGRSKPIVQDERNEADANRNRRVEVRVLSQ